MHYGTSPIVRETGGVKDTVEPYNTFRGDGNCFTVDRYESGLLLDAVSYTHLGRVIPPCDTSQQTTPHNTTLQTLPPGRGSKHFEEAIPQQGGSPRTGPQNRNRSKC